MEYDVVNRNDEDYKFALELQKRLNQDSSDGELEATELKPPKITTKQKFHVRNLDDDDFLNRTQNLVHPQWETLDPTPDVFALFGAFDSKFFQSRLKCVTLEWSKRMYSCAGICYSSKNRFGMAITIRLSEPLLKLRPRKDLVETMLHEMIHAYCFVLNIREGNGGHGPHFKKIMHAINKVAGTNITVYHTFNDEVNLYKQHWWRCNGICTNRSPFFGYVKRTSNRAPGPNDLWWAKHQESCGGTFMKIKEPDTKKKKNKTKDVPKDSADIRKFFNNSTNKKSNENKHEKTAGGVGGLSGFGGPIKSNGGGTLLINPKSKSTSTTSIGKAFPPTSYPGLSTDPFNASIPKNSLTRNTANIHGGNLRNVVGYRDLNEGSANSSSSNNMVSSREITGRGYTVGSVNLPSSKSGEVDRNHLRDIWSKRFGGEKSNIKRSSEEQLETSDQQTEAKRPRIFTEDNSLISDNEDWVRFDDDVMVREEPDKIITLSSDDDNDDEDDDIERDNIASVEAKTKPLTGTDRQNAIKQEILDETTNLDGDDIILIDDEYDDNIAEEDANVEVATALADVSVIDEFFGEDTLLKDFMLENDVRPTFSRHVPNPENDIVTCPVCQSKLKRIDLEEHLNGCMGISVKVLLPKHALKKLATTSREVKRPQRVRPSKKEVLRAAGYSEEDLAHLSLNSGTDDDLEVNNISPTLQNNANDTSRSERMRNVYKTTRQCPVCAQEIEEDEINGHLDECLTNR